MTLTAPLRHVLLETIETQQLGCELAGSPLYAAILGVVAEDVRGEGPVATLLEPVAAAPFGDAVLLRLLGALHLLVLEGRVPSLAEHFPSAGGSHGAAGRPGGAGRELAESVRAAVTAHADQVARCLEEGVQTNEVGRSAALLGGFLELARLDRPLRVLEVGASAGLNLLFDRYRYHDGGQSFGPTDSPLVFRNPWFGSAPDLSQQLQVVERRGCDLAPIDPTTSAGRTRLRSFVWADQLERLDRLDAALAVAGAFPPMVDRGAAPEWVRAQLEVDAPGCCTVVVHSIVFQYLSGEARQELIGALESRGAQATDASPLAWLRLEPAGDRAELRLTTWPGGRTQVLATSAFHGPPVVWKGR